jgi:hypothetical protein
MIIGITGRAGSGKDTVADHLALNYGFKKIGLADPIKRCVQDIFGISDGVMQDRALREQEVHQWPGWTVRKLLQFVGTELFREKIHPDIWVRSCCTRILTSDILNWVIPDVRFDNEDRGLRLVFGDHYKLIRVTRPGVEGAPGGIPGHASEAGLSGDPDLELMNAGGLEELYLGVDAFMGKQ